MAKEEKETAPEEKEEAAKPAKKGKGKLVMIIGGVFLLLTILAVGAVVTYTVIAPSLGLKPLFGGAAKKEHKKAAPEEEIEGVMYPLPPFIVNLSDEDEGRFIKVTLQLEVAPLEGEGSSDDKEKDIAKLQEELGKRLPQIQDQVLTLLSSVSMKEATAVEGKLKIKTNIMARLNPILKTGAISNIFFTEFVVQ